jgi:pimeloyl-ACP methyl ester carboxylesterase
VEQLEIPVGELVFTARADGPEGAPLVLLLHGFPQSSFEWRHQLPALAAAGYRAVAPDQRGYASSARPEGVEHYGIDLLMGDVLGMAEALGAPSFHVVGHDWGAIVAWHLAARAAGRVQSLGAVSVPHPKAFGRALAGEGGSDQAQRSRYFDDFRSDGAAERLLADDAAGLRFMFSASGLTGDVDEYVRVHSEPGALQGALDWYRAMGPATVDVDDVQIPTLFVWSTDDPALGPDGARWTAEHVTGPYRFEVIEGVGHWVPELVPDRLSELLVEHLRGTG